MICPYRKKIEVVRYDNGMQATQEFFMPCEERDCPLYIPEEVHGGLTVSAYCIRAEHE